MEDGKSVFLSKTFYGVLITVVAMVLKLAGIELGDQEGMLNDIMALIGAGLAMYGRIKAVKKIV